MWQKGLTLLVLVGLLSACIPTQRELRMERDLEEMKRRLAAAERSVALMEQDSVSEFRKRLDGVAANQADLQAALDAQRVEMQSLKGRLSDLRSDQEQVRDELALIRDDLSLKIAALEERQQQLVERTAEPAAGQENVAPETPAALYQKALNLIREQDDFPGGRQLLERFLDRYPDHDLAVNALYWIGESYYGEEKFENAILQFQDLIQKHAEHPKAAAALLKQALAFKALGDGRNARTILGKLLDEFPESPEAEKARTLLREWKKS